MKNYNPSKRLSEWAATLLSPYITLENEGGDINNPPPNHGQSSHTHSSLSVGLWSGNVELKNVELRQEAFEQFLNDSDNDMSDSNTAQIKWKLIQGSIDSIRIQIPWKRLLLGSAYSSTKCSVPESESGENNQEGGKTEDPLNKSQGNHGGDEPSCASGHTTVHIEGIKLLLGYEIIHRDPILNALQSRCEQNRNRSLSLEIMQPLENQLKRKIREEKNRILQIAERRLLAGLDPFPPSLMEGLKSIKRSSVQSGIPTQPSSAPETNAQTLNEPNDGNATVFTTMSESTTGTYRSRLENYLSSTIKSLLWRVFDSLSISVTQVQLSVVGCSHYDKDFASIMRRDRIKEGRKPHNEKPPQQQQQKQSKRQQKRINRKLHHRHSSFQWDHEINEAQRVFRRASFTRKAGPTTEEQYVDGRNAHHSCRLNSTEFINESHSIWAREGEVEVGLTLDRFDFRPGSLPSLHAEGFGERDSTDGVQADPSVLKLMRFREVGLFLRRKCSMISGSDGRWQECANADANADADADGLHTGKTLVWNDAHIDDYVIEPANIDASFKVYRYASGSSATGLGAPSPQKKEAELSDAHSKTSATDIASSSKGTRRGKRDKRKKNPVGELEVSSHPQSLQPNTSHPSLRATSNTGSEPGRPLHMPAYAPPKRIEHSVSSSASLSSAAAGKATHGAISMKRAHDDSLTSLHRLELSFELGNISCCVSPRQVFLVHSLSSSMTRLKRGRPPTTIRIAQAYDRSLPERMTEGRESHIYRELPPSLQLRHSRKSMRTIPGVVESWWKYACINVVDEIQQRKTLISQCSGDSKFRGNNIVRNIFSGENSPPRWDWENQSRIRREYIDLYLLDHASSGGQITVSSSEDEAAAAVVKFRLDQLEDELSVERILLLKHVARAASIRRARATNASGQMLELSSPADAYFCFPQNFHPKDTVDRTIIQHQIHSYGNVKTLQTSSLEEINGMAMHHQTLTPSAHFHEASASMAASKKLDEWGRPTQDSTITSPIVGELRDTLSFSVDLFLPGFSLALCDFHEGNSSKLDPEYGDVEPLFYRTYPSDDISVLTGFSDDDEDSNVPRKASAGDAFDPLYHFWSGTRYGLYCEPILLIHIADLRVSAQRRSGRLHPQHVESEFSVGGITIQDGVSPPEKDYLFRSGYIPGGESLGASQSIGVSGKHFCLNGSTSISVGPTEICVDWGWLKRILRFTSINKDMKPCRITPPLESEDLLARAFSKPQNETPGNIFSLKLDKLSLTIPVENTANDEKETHFLVSTVSYVHVRTGNFHDGFCEKPEKAIDSTNEKDPQAIVYLRPSQCLVLDLDGLDAGIISQTNGPAENSKTPLLRCPVSFQLEYSPGGGTSCSSAQSEHHSCRTIHARSSAIHVLVSELRLKVIQSFFNTIFNTFPEAGDAAEVRHLLNPPMPALAEYVLSETKLSIESLGIYIIHDKESPADNILVREQLENIISSFISQLSCLDFKHPSKISIACMSRLATDKCCALGIPIGKAKACTQAAEASYRREASALLYPNAPGYAEAKARHLRHRKLKRSNDNDGHFEESLDMNPESLSEALDEVVGRATMTTMAELGDILLHPDFNHSEHELVIDAELVLMLNHWYCGNTVQIKSKSLSIRNGQFSLLNVHPCSSGIQSSHQSSEGKKLSDEEKEAPEEGALTLSVQDRNVGLDRDSCRDIHFEVGYIESVFCPEEYLKAVKVCRLSMGTILGAETCTKEDSTCHSQSPAKAVTVNGSVSSLTLTLTDKLLPFIECRVQDITVEKSIIGNQAATKTSLRARAINLDCVFQSNYPNIISTYGSKVGEDSNNSSAVSIQLTSRDPTSTPNEVLITLDGVRIVLLRQTLGEFLQYVSSPNYGIGLFLRHIKSLSADVMREEISVNNAPTSNPSQLKVSINCSSLVLPRDSNSIDLVGVEVDEIFLSSAQVVESWSIDRYSFSDNDDTQSSQQSSSSEIFFDCMYEHDLRASGTPLASTPLMPQIPRFAVRIRGANIFVALNKYHYSTEKVHMPEFNAHVQDTGRAENNMPPFKVCGKMDKTLEEDVTNRIWEKVTQEPLNLRLLVDHAPMLRLLIEDYDVGDSCRVSFDMRLSQFYLLMSIWFSNMKELPIVFPYEIDFLEKSSIDPDPPVDWPEYGTSEFVKRLKCGGIAKTAFEMALCFKYFSWQCSYDHPNYYSDDGPPTMSMMRSNSKGVGSKNFISISFRHILCNIMMGEDTLQRIGATSTSMKVHDGRQTDKSFAQEVGVNGDPNQTSFVDLNWGLDCGRHTLIDGLPLPFQLTVFITPDRHCLINLGLDMAEAALADLTPVWILLDYFGLYFKESQYGHPSFEAKRIFNKSMVDTGLESLNECDNECLNIDFRLWIIQPHVIIPSSSHDLCVMLEAAGLYYHYKSFGVNYSSQEVVAKDLGIVMLNEYLEASKSRGLRQVSGSLNSCGVKTLVDGLSFSLRYDFNSSINYTRFALRVPLTSQHFDRHSMDGIESSNIEAHPFSVPPPLVCKPFVTPSRTMGHHETNIYFSHYMKLALDHLTAFTGPSQPSDLVNDPIPQPIFSVIAHVERVKCVISDPIMGLHRPILSICLPSLSLTASQLREVQQGPKAEAEQLMGRQLVMSDEAQDLQASMETTIFIDYFKLGLTRNWEPFVEPFKCLILYEKSAIRGKGVTINADCPLHLNITGALIETLDDAAKTFDLFRSESTSTNTKAPQPTKWESSNSGIVESVEADDMGRNLTVIHSPAEQLDGNERIAYSLKNTTGERLRVHAHSSLQTNISNSQTTITYLDNLRLMPLSFPATETAMKNLRPVEVPFKGDQNINSQQSKTSTSHEIDFQVPGFQWVRDISFDLSGKHFVELVPRSPSVKTKINEDWRLRNALHVLTEINSVNGGRRLTITSPFEVVNKTNHPIFLAMNPDPRHPPQYPFNYNLDSIDESNEESNGQENFAIDKINPEEVHNISHLLLESSLRMNGNHLGSIWIRPESEFTEEFFKDFPVGPNSSGLDQSAVGYPSRPIQLAKILHESSVIFKDSHGDPSYANQVASGVEVSCPIIDKHKSRLSKPFCYVVEVKRSPFTRLAQVETITPEASTGDMMSPAKIGKGLKTAKNIFSKHSAPEKCDSHSPIAYSLIIHAPLIIENFLPERGRFEIMDATSKNVLWWGNLEAGERTSVFTVGLDAPLFLLVNLGFCRTAVGEGALVHHGGGDGLFKAGWNTIGSAVKTSKDRVKRTLTTLSESKDNRGAKRVNMMHGGNMKQKDNTANRKVGQLGFNTENEMIEISGGGALRRGDGYGLEDIATELSVIDSLGQRLTLLIDNVLGSGGQRRISLYCPFWIVNTTEHSLRYKQEKALSYVSGTVLSPEKDGSKPVDGSYRCDIDNEECDGMISESSLDSLNTIFSGRPGAISLLNDLEGDDTKPPLLAALISEDLPLHVVSKLAFMFNFQDILSLGSTPKLCIQLADSTKTHNSQYTSNWSSGFGLESVGVMQFVSMHCKDGRGLEVSVSISVAPGRLSKYTKIIRICPRYLIVNQLPFPIRLWQDSSIRHPNLAVDNLSKDANESRKWLFTEGQREQDGAINQYRLLFGSSAMIECNAGSGMDEETTAHHDACFIATVLPSELVAFHLPDTRLERSLRVDFGSSWSLSPSFDADVSGEHVLAINRAMDLRMLPHVSSRGAPVYSVTLPPTNNHWNGELGIWFETDWEGRSLIVKGLKEASYASYFTDIVVGDELIMIDGIDVEQLTFDEAMKYLKVRLAALPLQRMRNKPKRRIQKTTSDDTLSTDFVTLTLRTLEERLRRLRRAAVSKNATSATSSQRIPATDLLKSKRTLQGKEAPEQEDPDNCMPELGNSSRELLVEMKYLYQSMFVFLRAADPTDPPHRIINRSLRWRIYFRQRGCVNHQWKCLSPGESSAYTWEEPTLKVKKLSVRVGVGEWIGGQTSIRNGITAGSTEGRKKRLMPLFSFQFTENEEQGHFGATKTVKLEEIGYMDKLPCPARGGVTQGPSSINNESSLLCQVDTEGATRVLIVSDAETGMQSSDETLVHCHLSNIRKEISDQTVIRAQIFALLRAASSLKTNLDPANTANDGASEDATGFEATSTTLSSIDERVADSEAVESELEYLMDYDEGLFITRRNQVVVEVIEATGLRSSDLNGLSNPYVKVGLFCSNKKRRNGSFGRKATRNTYYIENTLSPQWRDQSFIFDVPAKAISDPRETRRFSIQCVINSKERLTKDKFLGQAHVHLRNLKDQRENVGWYPLMGKLGQSGTGKDALDRICGSIRLRVQWVYDTPGLLEYYLLCSDRRLETLLKSKEGMRHQLKSLQDAAKQEKNLGIALNISRVPALASIAKFNKRKKLRITSDRRDSNVTTQEDRTNQPPKSRKIALGKAINAARVMVSTKRRQSTRLFGKRSAFSSFNQSMGNIDFEEDDGSSLEFDDSLQSSEMLGDDVEPPSSNCSYKPKAGDCPSDGPYQSPITPISSPDFASIRTTPPCRYDSMTNALLLRLRWQSWERHTNNATAVSTPLFYTSWNISRAFINGNSAKPQSSKVNWGTDTKMQGEYASMAELLKLPPATPRISVERENNHVLELLRSRASFSKAARRSLGTVLNPGGVLTIRPITALNLPETYTGMFVKVRYGNRICLSETVECKVAPVWAGEDFPSINTGHTEPQRSERANKQTFIIRQQDSFDDGIQDFTDIAEMLNPKRARGSRENDLNIQVEPFETSKSLRLTVIGERANVQSRQEIGVLEIPLGPALECCAQSMEDYEEDKNLMDSKGLPPAYVRWFPLMSPSDAVPIEGDMGKSSRPLESEKLSDNMFEEYFAPCIKLALLFRQNLDEVDGDYDDEGSTKKSSTDQYMYARLDRISAALIDSCRIKELLSFSTRDADLRISVTTAKTRLAVAVGSVQVDQESLGMNTKVPVILAPTPVKQPQPTVQFLAWKDNIRSKSDLDSFDYIAIQVQEMDIKIEESWLYEVWDFYLDVMKKREERANLWHQDNKANYSTAIFEVEPSGNAIGKAGLFLKEGEKLKKKKIYVRLLVLGFFKANLSYFKSAKSSWGNSDDEIMVDGDHPELFPHSTAADDAFLKWSENMTGDALDERSQYAGISIISAVFPSISEAPIRFEEKFINHVYESEGDIVKSLKSFYSAEALRQIYKIVGSLDFVGNPTMVLTSFRTGLRDFFLQPSRELKHITKNPSRLGVGVLKGTLSLVSNSTSGIFGFMSNLGATVGHTATMLTLDENFQRLHSEQKATRQRHYDRWKKKGFGHVTLMVTRPVYDIGFGVISASTGLLTEPYRGAKKGGLIGFTKGTAIGIIGVPVKTIVGISDAVAHVMESVHDIAKSVNILEGKFKPIERYRLPYVFGPKRMLLPFSQVDSRSAQLLFAYPIDKKAKRGEEVIVASEALHQGNGLEHYIVITTTRIVLFRLKVIDGQGFITVSMVWQLRLGKGVRITSSLGNRGHNGSILYVSRYGSRNQGDLKEAEDFDPLLHNAIPNKSPPDQNEQDQLSDSFFEGEEKYSNPETPKSFYPLGATTAALRLRTAWPFAASDCDEVTRFAIEGEFKQRLQLSRIHNAICCISGDFDSLIYEGNRNDKSEGVASFGPLIFEYPERNAENSSTTVGGDNLSFLYSSLEHTMWKCNGLKSPLLSDALRNPSSDGPSWLVESRARSMLIPPPPLFPSNIDITCDIEVTKTISEVENDQRSSGSTSGNFDNIDMEDYHHHNTNVSLPKNIASTGTNNDFERISANQDQDSFINEDLSVDTFGTSLLVEDSNVTIHPSSKSGPAAPKDLNASNFILEENPPERNLPAINETLSATFQTFNQPASIISLSAESTFSKLETGSLDNRLRRVENMLERLLGSDSPRANTSHAARSQTAPTHISQYDHDHLSATSSLNPLNTPTATHQSYWCQDDVVNELLTEISDLKQQLAAKKDSSASNIDSPASRGLSTELHIEVPLANESSDDQSVKKLRGRVKNIFRGRKEK